MNRVVVAGTGPIPFGKHAEQSLGPMSVAAASAALSDADLSVANIEAVYFGNAAAGLLTGQEMVRGQSALRRLGLTGQPVFNIENACASSSSAFFLAWSAVRAGQFDHVLVVGAEKMLHPDRSVTAQALASGVDQDELSEMRERLGAQASSIFMDLYAERVRAYADRSGASLDDFANIAVKNRAAGTLNPNAYIRTPTTSEEVLSSRLISAPLTKLMCAPNADGAAAVVLSNENAARRNGDGKVFVRSCAVTSDIPDGDGEDLVARAAAVAYEQAGLGPNDVDVVELHDATTPAELWLYEMLGLCPTNEGPELLRKGDTALGGRIPVNSSGGMLCRGHPVGASGLAQICELADQIRGRSGERQKPDARVGLAENSGGRVGRESAAASVTILSS